MVILWWSMLAMQLLTSASAARLVQVPAQAPDRLSLIIGVNEPLDLDPLSHAEDDARRVHEWLQTHPPSGTSRDLLLQGSGARRDVILQTLEAVLEEAGPQTTVLVYFAGHGSLNLAEDGSRLYLLPSDGSVEQLAISAVPLDHVEAMLSAARAHRTALIVDACHVAEARSARGRAPESVRRVLPHLRGGPPPPVAHRLSRAEVRLFASGYHQPAFEDPELRSGVYTHYLLRALHDAPDVELLEAHRRASAQVIDHTQGLQQPRWLVSEWGPAPVYLAATPATDRRSTRGVSTAWLEARGASSLTAPQWDVGTGLHVTPAPGPGTLASLALTAGWRSPPQGPTHYRSSVRLTSSHGLQPATDGRLAHVGLLEFEPSWGSRWSIGPITGAGLRARASRDGADAAPVVHTGASLRWQKRQLFVRAVAGALISWNQTLQPGIIRPHATPSVLVTMGWSSP